MSVLISRAPTRIDFGGGWTDVPPYSIEQGGCVCNVAIARYATATVRLRGPGDEAHGGPLASVDDSHDLRRAADSALAAAALARAGRADLRVSLDSDFPVGAGLGGSSAAGVAVLGALSAWTGAGTHEDPTSLAEASRTLEVEDLRVPGGRQDHYAAAFGGALSLRFGESTSAERIPISPAVRDELPRRAVVVYTGKSRISGETITAVLGAYRDREPRVIEALSRMKKLAAEMVRALAAGDLDSLGALVGEHWRWQRTLHPAIPTPLIDHLLDVARGAGAIGGKALGASGGGCVLAFAGRGREDELRRAIAREAAGHDAALEVLDFSIDETGFSWGTHQ